MTIAQVRTCVGGVISPLLLNVALHGLEEAAGVRYGPDGIRIAKGTPVLVRYCDDFVVCCHSRQQAEQVQARLAGWLAPRGLAFSDEKTKIVSLESGYDFPGFNIRRYRNGKLLIKPGKAAVRRVKRNLATEMRRLRGQNASAVLAAICPLDRSTLRLLKAQHGRCVICADLLLHADREPRTPEEWQRWHRTTRKAITRQLIARGQGITPDDARLIHTYCQRRATGAGSQEPASSRT